MDLSIRHLSLPLLLLISLTSQIRSESLVDLGLEILKTTAPCAAPCVLKNLGQITRDVNRTCLPNFISAIEKTFASGYQGSQEFSTLQDSIEFIQHGNQKIYDSGLACKHVKTFVTCSAGTVRRHCGSDIEDTLIDQSTRALAYYGCRQSNKGLALQCLTRTSVAPAIATCIEEFQSRHEADIQKFTMNDYKDSYTEFFIPAEGTTNPPKICQWANTYSDCLFPKLQNLCTGPAVQQMKDEINVILDLANCRRYNPRNDGLPCLAKPTLILEDIPNCINTRVNENQNPMFLKSFIAGRDPPFSSSFDFYKMCDLIELMDVCIEKKIKGEPACQGGLTIDLYRSIVTPFRDFIITEYCPNLGNPSNSQGYGTCKNKFTDFPYGRPDPNNSSGRLTVSIHLALALALTCLVSYLMVN